jgi:hypothetical protein
VVPPFSFFLQNGPFPGLLWYYSPSRPEGRRPLGRPRRRWEDNIKMGLQEVGWGAWTGLIWLRVGTGGGLLWMR